MDHVVALFVAAIDPAFDEANAAGAANPGAAVMRQVDAVHQRPVEQQLAGNWRDNGASFRVTLQIFRILLHLETNRPDVPGMSDLAVIEGCDPHEDAGPDRHVVGAAGVEAARHFQRPVAGGPAGRASHVRAIA